MFDHISSMETQSKRPADAVQLQVVTVTIYSRRRKYNGHVPVLNQWSHFLGQVFHASIQEHLSQLCRSQLLPGHLKTIQSHKSHVNNCRDVAPLCLSVRPRRFGLGVLTSLCRSSWAWWHLFLLLLPVLFKESCRTYPAYPTAT